ncbi:hypothetical protein BC827DRAFT_656953 [Russula dissimulans]|nr:hypothetical protein BC827DRAFT_656953 [Russula dissimulans]
MASDLHFCQAAVVDVLATEVYPGHSHVSVHEPLLPVPETPHTQPPNHHPPHALVDTAPNRWENGMLVHDCDPQEHNTPSLLNLNLLAPLLLPSLPNPATAAPARVPCIRDLDPATANLPHHHHASESFSTQAASDGEHHPSGPNQSHFSYSKVPFLLRVKTLVILTFCLFLGLDITPLAEASPLDWVGVVATIAAVLIVNLVGSRNDWERERQLEDFSGEDKNPERRLVKVLRDGSEQQIGVQQVVVGDVVVLKSGEVIPCDGIFLSGNGNNIFCDESGMTGHTDDIMKASYDDCIARARARRPVRVDYGNSGNNRLQGRTNFPSTNLTDQDCFLVSGSRILTGTVSYVVTAVGKHCRNGRIIAALRGDWERTPLQHKLNDLAETVSKIIGPIVKFYVCALLVLLFRISISHSERTACKSIFALVQLFISAVTGLPFAITLTSAFATKQMTKENLSVRSLKSCETLADVSVICTDKTGTLTQNEMTVVAASIGVCTKFVRNLHNIREWTSNKARASPNSNDVGFAIDLSNVNSALTPQLVDLFKVSIVVNSTASEDVDPESGVTVFTGSKTDTALLKFAKELGWAGFEVTREAFKVVQTIPFSSDHKSVGCVVKLPDRGYRLFIKGASEILTQECTRHVVVYRDTSNGAPSGNGVEAVPIGETEKYDISYTVELYASQTLRTIALCYRDFSHWPPKGARVGDNGEVEYDDLATDLTLIAIVGIEDPLREGVQEAVANCNQAGVRVTMCTGDNVLTAWSIAQQCGIHTPGGTIMEGARFRALAPDDLKAIAPRLQILARCTPEDKRLLVETLKELDEVVCVAGDGTNDGPALDAAHVGLSMGIGGTEVTKEAADIILMDDNFSSIVRAIMWSRCWNDSVRKIVQHQMPAKIAVIIAMLASSSFPRLPSMAPNVVQLFWILAIVDFLAVLALATERPTPALLMRQPNKMGSLFTVDMIKHILGHLAYQTIIVLCLPLFGAQILGHQHGYSGSTQTLVFNAFVFAQIFNTLNSRRLDRKLNVFDGILDDRRVLLIVFIGSCSYFRNSIDPFTPSNRGLDACLDLRFRSPHLPD